MEIASHGEADDGDKNVGLENDLEVRHLAGIEAPASVDGLSMVGESQRDWLYGEYGVGMQSTRMIHDGRFKLDGGSMFGVVPKVMWEKKHPSDEFNRIALDLRCLLAENGDRRILVDTCIGNDKERAIPNWSNLQTTFLADLESAGYPRESIDTVLCTHLHVDHVGWNTMLVDGAWVPTFPNARYLLADKEFQYWNGAEADALNNGVMEDSVTPVVEAGLVDLVDWEHQVCAEVSLKPTPGHTPGHVSILIRSGGQTALITGDCFHHPCQMSRVGSSRIFSSSASRAGTCASERPRFDSAWATSRPEVRPALKRSRVIWRVSRCASTLPSASPRWPITTRTGMPIRSASLNFTPARASRSSTSTSTPAWTAGRWGRSSMTASSARWPG